ncbi:MAG: hypothetical protein VXZ84_06430, partial [Planctomycetota bacterium]|nr:hypothetical protein [Planctomycetota bacterium]
DICNAPRSKADRQGAGGVEQEIEQNESEAAPEYDQCKGPKAPHDGEKQNRQQQKNTRFNHHFILTLKSSLAS